MAAFGRYAGPRRPPQAAFRSGLEEKNSELMDRHGIPYTFEQHWINYTIPARTAKYLPDFILGNGIIIECKGIWEVDDRKKHLLLREQYPELDIRLVFSSSKAKLYKGSPTTYGAWCEKHDIQFADKLVPLAWMKEKKKQIPDGILKEKGA